MCWQLARWALSRWVYSYRPSMIFHDNLKVMQQIIIPFQIVEALVEEQMKLEARGMRNTRV